MARQPSRRWPAPGQGLPRKRNSPLATRGLSTPQAHRASRSYSGAVGSASSPPTTCGCSACCTCSVRRRCAWSKRCGRRFRADDARGRKPCGKPPTPTPDRTPTKKWCGDAGTHRPGARQAMLIGYARVSTRSNLELQREALSKAGCKKVFEDKVSGTRQPAWLGQDARNAARRRYFGRLEARPAGPVRRSDWSIWSAICREHGVQQEPRRLHRGPPAHHPGGSSSTSWRALPKWSAS